MTKYIKHVFESKELEVNNKKKSQPNDKEKK